LTGTIIRARSGDPEAFESLVRAYEDVVRRTVWRMCYRPDLTQDITQEVFLQVWKRLPQLREPEAFLSWLYKVTYSVATRFLSRESSQQTAMPEERLPREQGPEESLVSREGIKTIRDELARMDARYRVALGLYLEGLSYDEIARVMGVPARTVETRLRRARRGLQERLAARERSEQDAR